MPEKSRSGDAQRRARLESSILALTAEEGDLGERISGLRDFASFQLENEERLRHRVAAAAAELDERNRGVEVRRT
jgi:hypothetical protein